MAQAASYSGAEVLAIDPLRRQCLRCHRSLATCAGPYGRRCKRRPRIAPPGAMDGFSAGQAERAWPLLDDGALVATRRPGIYCAVAARAPRPTWSRPVVAPVTSAGSAAGATTNSP